MRTLLLSLAVLVSASVSLPLYATQIGVSKPALSLTVARVKMLPAAERGPWLAYLKRSEAQKRTGEAELAAERKGMSELPPLPGESFSARSIPTHRDAAFYKSDEARHIAEVILSFQTPEGGWSKNLNMAGEPRLRGQSYAAANLAPVGSGPDDFDAVADPNWHYVGTLDNDATNTELHFLADMAGAWPGHEGDAYRASFLRGIHYLLEAQYPNGGFPQVWPLEGGYHDAITFNDDAVTESAEILTLTADGKQDGTEDYSFVPAELRVRARAAAAKALECILAAQVRQPAKDGRGTLLTVWAQQEDPLTLAPESGRNFEPAALCSTESADVVEYLMSLPHPSPAVERSVEAAEAWFEAHKIMGYAFTGGRRTPGGRKLEAQPGAGPIWARYYSLGSSANGGDRPIFGDRNKGIYDKVMDLSLERRNGYGWYGAGPEKVIEAFPAWKAKVSA